MRRDTLTFGQRAFVATISKLSQWSEGYVLGFIPELVRQHGVGGFFKWAKKTEAGWNALIARYGEKDAHLLAGVASMWNGCDYCTYGHLIAYNLHHFEETGALFPLDEAEVPALLRKRDIEVLAVLREHFGDSPVMALIERQYALKMGEAVPGSDEDAFLMRTIALYEWINECSITVDAPAPPLGSIAKKKALMARYAQARLAARAARRAAHAPAEQPAA